MESDPTPDRSRSSRRGGREDERGAGGAALERGRRRALTLDLNDFAWETIEEQSDLLGVSVEELVGFSVLYYIADMDSKRIARRLPPSQGRPLVDRER